MTNPRISVIVPVYNCAPYIKECLRSLKDQTFGDFEVLVVDDGSTDGSLDWARACVSGDERFRFDVLPQRGGQSVARNVALDQARGDFIALLDADDLFIPEALEKMLHRAECQNLDDLYFSARSFYESQEMHQLVREDFSERLAFEHVATGQELFTFFENKEQFFPQAALRFVRRSLIEQHGIRFYEGIIHEDVLFTFQTLAVSSRSSFLNEVLYRRRIRPGSTMTAPKRTIANVRGHFVCAQEMMHWMRKNADHLELSFMEAMTHRISEYLLLAARDWFHDIDEEDRMKYLTQLSSEDRLTFFQEVIHPGAVIEQLNKEFYESKTYRLGNAILAAPRTIRNKVGGLLTYRKEK